MDFKFSIIIPIHHEYGVISHCLESIFAQTYKNFEVICALDNSPSRVEEILSNYDVQYYKGSFNKPGLTRNLGLEHATGDYIWFIDCDDQIPSCDVLERINQDLQDNPDELVWHLNSGCSKDGTEVVVGTRVYKLDFLRKYDFKFPNSMYDEDVNFIQLISTVLHKRKDIYNEIPYYYYSFLNPGSITGNRHYGKALGFAFTGCGKTYAAHHSSHGIATEPGLFKRYNQVYLFINYILQEIHTNNFGFLINCEAEILKQLDDWNVPVNIIMPCREMKEEILARIAKRDGADSDWYHLLSEKYDEIYDKFANGPGANIFYLQPGEYISDYLPQLDQMNFNVWKKYEF